MFSPSPSIRRVLKTRIALVILVGIPLLFLASGCSSGTGTRSADVTGSIGARPVATDQTSTVSSRPGPGVVQTRAARGTNAVPARDCKPDNRRADVTGSIPRSSAAGNRRRPARNVARNRVVAHVIAPEETLYSIARRYRTSVGELAQINGINTDATIRFGDTLIVPVL